MKNEDGVIYAKPASPIRQASQKRDTHEYIFCAQNSPWELTQLQEMLKWAEKQIRVLEKELQNSQKQINTLEVALDHDLASLDREVEARKEMEKHAGTDILTGIMNRRAILQGCLKILHEELRKDESERQYISMLFIDADRFKNINDTYGHSMGDSVLKRLAERLDEIKRYEDVIGRYGWEEFLCIVPHKNIDDVIGVANRILEEVRRIEVFGDENECLVNPLKITISIGVNTFRLADFPVLHDQPGENTTKLLEQIMDDSIKNADTALYMAKKTGRDRICYYK